MHDFFGRKIDYMRISLTDRCNMRCKYCMPNKGAKPVSYDEILRYEEIFRICKVAIKSGIHNFKITGGEPLLRSDCVNFLRELKSFSNRVTMTTNASLLEPALEELYAIKLDGINVSLDSLNPDTYQDITGKDNFSIVWSAVVKAVELGFKIKINCVPIRGLNDADIIPMAQLADKMPIDVRFIEFMPSGVDASFKRVTSDEIVKTLKNIYPDLVADTSKHGMGPARYFTNGKMMGSVGIIDAIGKCFCSDCNRVRLTSYGFLKLCLFNDIGLDLRTMVRSGASDSEIESAFCAAVFNKPENHFNKHIKNMSHIGG